MATRRIRSFLVALAIMLSGAAAAEAQEGSASAQQRARASLAGANLAAFDAVVASARARGLPLEPLFDKVLEGAAKRVPADRIVAVARLRADQLARAQELSGIRSGAEITAVADALQRGVPERVVTDLRKNAKPNEPFGLALHTFADLLVSGVPADAALEVLAGWRTRGARPNELRELPAVVERLMREGVPASRAAVALAAALHAGNPASAVRADAAGRVHVNPVKINKPLVNPKGTAPGQIKKKN